MEQCCPRSESVRSLRGRWSHSPAGCRRCSTASPVPRGLWRSGSALPETPSWPASGGRCRSAAVRPHSASARSPDRCTFGCVSTACRRNWRCTRSGTKIPIGQTLSSLSPRFTPCKQLSLHTAFHGISFSLLMQSLSK